MSCLRKFLSDVEKEFKHDEEKITSLEKALQREREERAALERKLQAKEKECESLEKQHRTLLTALKQRFSQTQIDRIINPKSKTHWSQNDIRKAITMLSCSEMGYLVAKKLLGLPVAARSGVKALLSNISFEEGVMDGVLDLMRMAGEGMTLLQRQVVLSFDEVQLADRIVYDTKKDKVEGPHKLLQAACVTGMFANFTNPVYYKNSQAMTKDILLEIISALYKIGFHVRAIVCDLGFDNQDLLTKQLKLNEEKPYFEHPEAKYNVYVWSDPPHNEKLLRNHTLDNSIDTDPSNPGEAVATRWALQTLVNKTGHVDLPSHPLTQQHINVQGHDRQICKLANDVLDSRTAEALRRLASEDDFEPEEKAQLKVIIIKI